MLRSIKWHTGGVVMSDITVFGTVDAVCLVIDVEMVMHIFGISTTHNFNPLMLSCHEVMNHLPVT